MPSTVSSSGATRATPAGSSISRSMSTCPRAVRAAEASPSCRFTTREPTRKRRLVPPGEVMCTSPVRRACSKRWRTLRQRRVVGLQQGALVERVDDGTRRQRLSGQRKGAAVLDPVEVHGAPAALAQQVLQRGVGRVRRRGAGHHDRAVHAGEHRPVGLARPGVAAAQDLEVPTLRHRLGEHVHHADVGRAGPRDRIAKMRHEVLEETRMRQDQELLARLRRQPGDQLRRDRRPVEGELGLRDGRSRRGQDQQGAQGPRGDGAHRRIIA